MADAGKKATTTYTSYAGQDALTIGFPYLDKDHVIVTDNAVPSKTYVRGTDYEIETANPTQIEWTVKPASGLTIYIKRDTPDDEPIISFAEGKPVLGASLNTDLLQVLYYQQEVEDKL